MIPQHYDLEPWKIHVVDLFDYVDEPLRSQLLRLNRRTAAPLGGRIDYDVDGTLAGSWFVEGTNWIGGPRGALVPAATHVSISPHHINPVFTVFSLGDFGGQPRQYWATGNRPSPASVTVDSGPVKYELVYGSLLSNGDPFDASQFPPQGVLLVRMLSARRLRLEAFPGRTLAQVTAFTSAAKIYER